MYLADFLQHHSEIQTKVAGKFQILDLLQLSRTEREAKEICLQKLQDLHKWEINFAKENEPSMRHRTAILHRQAREAIKIYKLIRKSRVKIFKIYMDELPAVGTSKRLAS